MKSISIKNNVVRNSISEKYFRLSDLLLNPVEFIRFLVDLISNH